jgi:hypothetical protein
MIGANTIELENAQRRGSIFVVALLGALAGLASCTSSGTKPPPAGSGGNGGVAAGTGGSTGSSTGGSTGSSTGGSTGSSAGGSNQPDAAPPDLAPPRDADVPTDAVIVTDASTTATRSDLNFDTDWRFNLGDVAGADAKAFVDTAWGYVDLPHSPRFNTPESPAAYGGIMWYRKHFTVPSSAQGAKVFIEFGAAMQLADVYVNGTHKPQHQGGYAPFTFDITGDVAYGGADNVIAVKLDTRVNASWPPGKTDAPIDFQFHGGLYRHVIMHVTNALHVTDAVYANKTASGGVFVTYPAVSTTSATVSVRTNVINESTSSKSAMVISRLLDSGGTQVGTATASSSIAAGADFDFVQTIPVTNPKLWNPNSPSLYTLQTTVQDGATAVDSVSTHVGIRSIGFTHAGGMTINGTRVKALGVNLLEETYGLGNAISDQSYYYDVKRVRDAGLTFIRTSHYPHAPAFYDACDALGVVVMDSQTGWQAFQTNAAFSTNSYQELRDLIRRDRNHPSVVIWEANLNESGFTDAWAQMANSIVHAEYPGNQAFSAQWLFTRADILIDATQHNIRSSNDARPILINEYGDWDYGAGATGGVTSRQAREAGDAAMLQQAANVQNGQGLSLPLPWFTADAYWEWADYGGYGATATLSGLTDMYRLPKHAYYFLQSQRDPTLTSTLVDAGPVVYIANQWTSTSPTSVKVFSNCDQVRLSLNGTVVATRSPDTTPAPLPLRPPFTFPAMTFAAGTLSADCLIAGTVRATTTRRTPGAATALRLRPEGTTMRADLGDARLVFVDVIDANGTVVPTDNRQVTLSLTGPGTIVGPATITMKGGQLATWVRPGRTAGTITLTAAATGLTSGTATLTSQAVAGLPPAPAGR